MLVISAARLNAPQANHAAMLEPHNMRSIEEILGMAVGDDASVADGRNTLSSL
jgi:hypothetical protein